MDQLLMALSAFLLKAINEWFLALLSQNKVIVKLKISRHWGVWSFFLMIYFQCSHSGRFFLDRGKDILNTWQFSRPLVKRNKLMQMNKRDTNLWNSNLAVKLRKSSIVLVLELFLSFFLGLGLGLNNNSNIGLETWETIQKHMFLPALYKDIYSKVGSKTCSLS